MKLSRRKKKIILLIIAIVLVILFIALIFLLNYKNEQEEIYEQTASDEELVAESVESYMEDKTCPRGMATLYTYYDGENSLNDLYRSFYKFVRYLPDFSKEVDDLSESELEDYFDDNEKSILDYFGITTEDEFEAFVEYIKTYDFSSASFQYCEIDTSTYNTENEEYLTFNLAITYEGMDETVDFIISFSNIEDLSPEVIYTPIE